jgi:sugar phosphate isomerase/epimerase
MPSRRQFLSQSLTAVPALSLACSYWSYAESVPQITISLAEWSLHRALFENRLNHLDFPEKAMRDFAIRAVEYVNTFFGTPSLTFQEAGQSSAYLHQLLKRSQDAGVTNHLIMVDDEGPLAQPADADRLKAVDNHKKWAEAAKLLRCLSIRVNLHGDGTPEDKKSASIDSLGRLGEFAESMDINVLVENDGQQSSDGSWVADVMRQVGMSNVGTLPDFGNFCLSHPWGSTQDGCDQPYDRYKGVQELLPYAKGVSAKTYDFDKAGNQPLMDYERLLRIVKSSGFNGYIGVEYEGNAQSEDEGIRLTKALLERSLS